MKRYYPRGPEGIEMVEDPLGAYVRIEDHEAIIRRQAVAALNGMNAAKAISYHDLQQAHRLRAESSPAALESERAVNAMLSEENDRLRNALRNCCLLAMKRLAKGSYEIPDWESILRFCTEGGEGPSPLRSSDSGVGES